VRSGDVVACGALDEMDAETARLCAREGLSRVVVMPVRGFGAAVVGLWTIWGVEGMPIAEGLRGLGHMVCDLAEAALRIRERIDDLHRSARADSLTGLANRVAFDEAVRACTEETSVAMLYINLDRFKLINDTHGHLFGDTLLEVVARRMAGEVHEQDVVARLGGDEFAVLCPTCDKAEAEQLAERIIRAVRRPIVIDAQQVSVGASIGVAHSALHASDLLRSADQALYVAESAGRGRVHVNGEVVPAAGHGSPRPERSTTACGLLG